jgi:hypothetical protein
LPIGKWERGKSGYKFRVLENVETGGQVLADAETLEACKKTTPVAEKTPILAGKDFDSYHSDGHDLPVQKLKHYRFVRCSEPILRPSAPLRNIRVGRK